MAKMKKNKTTKIIYKMLHRKLNNDQHESHYKLGRGGGGGGGYSCYKPGHKSRMREGP